MRSHRTFTRREPLSGIQPESGAAFTARTHHPHLSSHKRPSRAHVLEDGRPLPGPANALHDDVRSMGRGRFSFWYDYVYFSTTDNSDPRTNGRRYEIEYPVSRMRAAADAVRERLRTTRKPRGTTPSTFELQLRMWDRIGFTPSPESMVLDFGCGAGGCVDEGRKRGVSVFGCDLALPRLPVGPLLAHMQQGIIRPIATDPYRIPFDDEMFDLVFSHTVLEHVMDYDATLAEIARVLKPGGISVHLFPASWKLIETHVFVPLASRVQSYWWLYLWAMLGVRNEFQHGLSARQTADANFRFLRNETNYLRQAEIEAHVRRYFDGCQFAEEASFPGDRYHFFMKHSRVLPIYRRWYSETHGRVLVCRGKKRRLVRPEAERIARSA